jgi:hypothetical protein
MLEPQPDFDPHDLKQQGAKTQKSAHVNEPYEHQEFPKVLYRTSDGQKQSIVVHSQEESDKATGAGFGEVVEAPEDTPAEFLPAMFSQVIYTNAAGDVVGKGPKQEIEAVAVAATKPVTLPAQSEADAAAQPHLE